MSTMQGRVRIMCGFGLQLKHDAWWSLNHVWIRTVIEASSVVESESSIDSDCFEAPYLIESESQVDSRQPIPA